MKQVSLLEHSPREFDHAYDDGEVNQIVPNILDSHFASISVSNCERSDSVKLYMIDVTSIQI